MPCDRCSQTSTRQTSSTRVEPCLKHCASGRNVAASCTVTGTASCRRGRREKNLNKQLNQKSKKTDQSKCRGNPKAPDAKSSSHLKKDDSVKMNATNDIAVKTVKQRKSGPESGEQSSLPSNGKPFETGSTPGARVDVHRKNSLLITLEMAKAELKCHYQTLLYREGKGQLTPIKIRGRKFYALGEIKKLKAEYPVRPRKRTVRKTETIQQPISLWTKIVKFIRACVAR